MTVGGLIPSQTYKDLVACEDNTAESYGGLHEVRWLRGLLTHFDRQMRFPLVFMVNAGL